MKDSTLSVSNDSHNPKDGAPRENYFKMWAGFLEKQMEEARSSTVFSIPILVQKPPVEPDSVTGCFPMITGTDLLGFVGAMGLAQIPELYFLKMEHKNEGDDYNTGMEYFDSHDRVGVFKRSSSGFS
jgi:hypothetical protein